MRSQRARQRVTEREQRRGCDCQSDTEADRDDQDGFPTRHRPDLASSPADELQQGELAPALQRDHRERVDHGDRREGEDDPDEEWAEPAVCLALGVARVRQ